MHYTCGWQPPVRRGSVSSVREDWPHILRGLFPGDPDAIAEIRVELRGFPRNVRWTTTHTYPAAGQVLSTKSSVTIPDSVGTERDSL